MTPDPGVIDVNVQPASNWDELTALTETLYEEARLSRLGTGKFMLDGRHTGTGGGNHVIGRHIERADMTTRIVDVRSANLLLTDVSDLRPFDTHAPALGHRRGLFPDASDAGAIAVRI